MPRWGTDWEEVGQGGGGRSLSFTILQGDTPVVSGEEESKIKFFHSVVIT